MPLVAYLLARFCEPSSYAGLGALLALAGVNVPDPIVGQLAQLLAAACGLLALVLEERGTIRAIVLVFAVAPVLAGCGGVPAAVLAGIGSAGAVYSTIDKVTEAASPVIATACGEYAKAKAVADAAVALGGIPGATVAKLAAIESFGDAACGSGSGPPSGDPAATAIWLGQLAGQLVTLAKPAQG